MNEWMNVDCEVARQGDLFNKLVRVVETVMLVNDQAGRFLSLIET